MIKDGMFEFKDSYDINDAVRIVKLLRDPEYGCPWDKEQTHASIRKNFIEEVYEVCDAIDKGDRELLREELGDVFLQVALHSEIERQNGSFDINEVADALCKKLIMRHPHVFGDVEADTSSTVLANWELIKRAEKKQDTAVKAIDDVPASLPALAKSQKTQKRAGDFGFDYENVGQAVSDLKSELAELEQAIAAGTNVEEELGDLIFSSVNVARLLNLDAEQSLEFACKKFVDRFRMVESAAREKKIDMRSCGIDTLNELWNTAKQKKER